MNILFVGEALVKSNSGIVTVMCQILKDETFHSKIKFTLITTTSNHYSILRKSYCWLIAYTKFFYYLQSCSIVHIHHASSLNFWLSAIMLRIAKRFNKKVLLHNHSADFQQFYEQSSTRAKRNIQKTFKMADGNIVLSKSWIDWYHTISPEANWIMLHNAVEMPKNIRLKTRLLSQANLIYLARIEQRKGFFDLLKSMSSVVAQFPTVMLYVAGQGDEMKALELIEKYKIEKNVNIMGQITPDERDQLLRRGHIFILPSYGEGLPMSLLEAMSYGLVPLTTIVGGIPDVITSGKNGLLIEPGDIDGLKLGLFQLLNDEAAYYCMSVNSVRSIKDNFNYLNYGSRLLKIYNSL